eukprot:1639871-Rhodomonas_salina.1
MCIRDSFSSTFFPPQPLRLAEPHAPPPPFFGAPMQRVFPPSHLGNPPALLDRERAPPPYPNTRAHPVPIPPSSHGPPAGGSFAPAPPEPPVVVDSPASFPWMAK